MNLSSTTIFGVHIPSTHRVESHNVRLRRATILCRTRMHPAMKPCRNTGDIIADQQLYDVKVVTEQASTNARKNAGWGNPSTISVGRARRSTFVTLFSKLQDGRGKSRGDEVTIYLTPNDSLRLAMQLIDQANSCIPQAEHPHPKIQAKLKADLERQLSERKKHRKKKAVKKTVKRALKRAST